MRKLLLLVMAAVISLGFCFNCFASKVIKLNYTDENAEAGIAVKASTMPYLDKIEEVTNGAIKIDRYFSSTFNAARDVWDTVSKGIADIGWISLPHNPGRLPLTDVMGLPGLPAKTAADRAELMWKLYEHYPEIQNEFYRANLRPLLLFTTEPSHIITRKKPVQKLEDLKNMKIRTLGGPGTTQMKLLGAVPINLPMSDIYLSLEKGVLDGIACSVTAVATWRFFEVTPYITPAPLTASYLTIVINNKTFLSLSEEIQQQIMSVSGLEGSRWYAARWCDDFVNQVPELAAAANKPVTYYDLGQEEWARWMEVSQPTIDAWLASNKSKGYGEIAEKILATAMNNDFD